MKVLSAVALLLLAANVARADVSVIDNNKKLAIDCRKDPKVELIGNHITATLTGSCTRVQIMGNHAVVTGSTQSINVSGHSNVATLDAVDDITITGKNNAVSWRKGSTKKSPTVASSGKDNKVTQIN